LYHSNTFSMKCYLITKKINKDSSVSSENRFIFDIYKVSLDKKMVDFFKTGSLDTLNKMVGNNELEYHDYSVISDDGTDAIYGYANIEDLEFRKVLEKINKGSGINILKSLEEVKSDILAFCLKISTQDDGFTIYRKLTKSKVATDTPLNTFQKMQAIFDVNSATMKVVPMQTVSFDKKIDFIFKNNKIYIVSKLGFEQIIGIEKEFVENARSVLKVISDASIIDNIKILEEVILTNKTLQRTIASIAQKKNHENLSPDIIIKYQETLNIFEGAKLEEKNGRLVIKDASDARLLIKVLNDFYKQGVASGKYYGTNSGHIIDKKNN
ncbi:Kiwa anti-phage protein KwaB-like domain-containing protein, partial [Escherichia coli]